MKKSLLLTGFLLFSFFILFSYFVHKDIFTQFDFDTTVRLQDNMPRRFDGIFSFFSDIGIFEVSLVFLITILVILRKLSGTFVLIFFGLFHFIELYGKTFVSHLPPPEFMLRTERVFNFPQYHVRLENSYPSGHAGRAAFLGILIALLVFRSKKLTHLQKITVWAVLIIYELTMFVSRVYLGEHWSSDVIGGILLGSALSVISFVFI